MGGCRALCRKNEALCRGGLGVDGGECCLLNVADAGVELHPLLPLLLNGQLKIQVGIIKYLILQPDITESLRLVAMTVWLVAAACLTWRVFCRMYRLVNVCNL